MKNELASEKIINIIKSNSEDLKNEILDILFNEIYGERISTDTKIVYCSCGYPICTEKNGKQEFILEIIEQEVELRNNCEYFYCPKCNTFLDMIQH